MAASAVSFYDVCDMVKQYYGYGSDEWVKIAKYGTSSPDALRILRQVPGVNVEVNADGTRVLGWDYFNSFAEEPGAAASINSNAQLGMYGGNSFNASVPGNATGTDGMTSGATVSSTGQTLAAVADRVSLGVAGVSLGARLGIAIDSALYAAAPDWWDQHYPYLNPATWSDMIPQSGAGALVRTLLGVGEGQATTYIDERLLAYTYQTLLEYGAFAPGAEEGEVTYTGDTTGLDLSGVQFPVKLQSIGMQTGKADATAPYHTKTYESNVPLTAMFQSQVPGQDTQLTFAINAATEPGAAIRYVSTYGSGTDQTFEAIRGSIKGESFWYTMTSTTGMLASTVTEDIPILNDVDFNTGNRVDPVSLAYALLNGTYSPGAHPGMARHPEASIQIDPSQVINPTTGQAVTPQDNVDDALQGLQAAYPGIFTGTVYQDVPQEDGRIVRYTYVPVPYPTTDPQGYPVTDILPGIDPQVNPQVDPQTQPQAAQSIVDNVIDTPEPPDTGDGNAPEAEVPTGSASALYSIYNPTQAEVSSFGAWLWSSDFVEQLKKLFNDPMQSIIGLHKVFAPPPIGGRSNIRVGYLDSGVSASVVSGQYVTVACGSVAVPEYFGNVFDYAPYTTIQIYLPFVGIQPLDVGDVMRGTVAVTYHVDVITGACLAEVAVTRDSAGGTLYSYAGNAAVQYPISSGSYMGILSSVISVAGGVAGTIASGGAMAPLAMGAASGILGARTRVQHSGGFSGNAGAMGARKPYLIITRPQSATASNFQSYEGSPANHTTTLGSCSGFVRIKAAHLDGIPATGPELTEIEGLLSAGIVI